MAAKIEGSTDGGCFSRQAKGNDAHLEGVDDDWHRSALSRVLSRVVEDLEPPSLVESLRRQRDVIVDELFAALADEGLLKREGPTPGTVLVHFSRICIHITEAPPHVHPTHTTP